MNYEETFISEPEDNVDGDPFLYSLETLTPDDIAPPPEKKPKTASERIAEASRIAVLVLCIAVFAGSLFYILRTLYYYNLANKIYSDIKLELDDPPGDATVAPLVISAVRTASESSKSPTTVDFINSMSLTNEDYAQMSQSGSTNQRVARLKAKLNAWKQQSNDVYGYIKIANTNIDDIIVQTTDDDYYLTHSWKGDYLPNGAIYADHRNYKNVLKNFNTVLYGHHMTDGTMFNTLDYFFKEEFFRNNRYIEIYTFDGIFTYEVFAVYIIDMYYPYIRTAFNSGEEFKEFAYKMKSNSIFQHDDIEFNENDRILTLSTCTNRVQTDRISVQAKLVKIER